MKAETMRTLTLLIMMSSLWITGCASQPDHELKTCTPTPYDEIGPFYRPDAPIRMSVGKGYVLSGKVLSLDGCTPLPKSKIEFWLVNPKGEYDDAHRATVYTDKKGKYRFECNRPPVYIGRLPHIHMKITAGGHEDLITQHYPKENKKKDVFNIVLEPLHK